MTRGSGDDVLGSVRELERALDARAAVEADAEARLEAARTEATAILQAARARATRSADERRRAALAAATASAAEIRREAEATAAVLRQRASELEDDAVGAALEVVLPATGESA